jgi:hypothetical protein
MASLREYFLDDSKDNMTTGSEWEIKDDGGHVLGLVSARLHLDFDANAIYVSFYVPDVGGEFAILSQLIREVGQVLDSRKNILVQSGFPGHMHDSEDLVFTGQVYLYSERPVSSELEDRLAAEHKARGYHLSFRSVEYVEQRMRAERPRAFISHDSRDKALIAAPLALRLSQMMTPVWYDEYSLKVGDSLRESIEQGLKECQRCVLILTPNFLKNGGWSKREYDTIFTREIVEKKKLVLPIWHDVSVADVFEYSPILADKVAVNWTEGVDQVARKLHFAIEQSYSS